MKMKPKLHPNIPSLLITDHSHISAPFLGLIRDTVTFLLLFELESNY